MGEFSTLTIKLLFLFLPGIIYNLLYERWNFCPKKEFNMFIIHSFLWGVISYTIYFFIIKTFKINQKLFFINDILDVEGKRIHYSEIIWTCLIAFSIVYFVSHWKNHKVNKKILEIGTYKKKLTIKDFLNKLKPSYVENSLGVWDSVFSNMYEENSGWIKVHNLAEKLIYYGYVEKYSDTVENNELYLVDVQVINSKGKIVEEVDAVYLSIKKEDIIIEFVKDKEGVENDRKTKQKRKLSKTRENKFKK